MCCLGSKEEIWVYIKKFALLFFLEKSVWSVLLHLLYSPDLAPSDFHLFGPLKQHLGSRHFAGDDGVQHEVLLCMRQQPKEFYAAGIGVLMKRCDKCINIGGHYVEK
ncbi:hypothetical protein AVEN_143043-1 [Araneus ventricosus]|uniref:Uncharacterized protein n=1 Tax=Araneus ventricosus TaxID=182803 RepID=A0A4Y2B2I1_ARAVE|nr:hypothetical protein AVEN_143043-1 [Araneus ventricosus]